MMSSVISETFTKPKTVLNSIPVSEIKKPITNNSYFFSKNMNVNLFG
jgi:hypothetical protein